MYAQNLAGSIGSILEGLPKSPYSFAGNWDTKWGDWRNIKWKQMTEEQQKARMADDTAWRKAYSDVDSNQYQKSVSSQKSNALKRYRNGQYEVIWTPNGLQVRMRRGNNNSSGYGQLYYDAIMRAMPGGGMNLGNQGMSGNFAISHPEIAAEIFGPALAAALASIGAGDTPGAGLGPGVGHDSASGIAGTGPGW